MREETKMKVVSAFIVVAVAGWCFIPILWSIDAKISGNNHLIDVFIYTIITCAFFLLLLYFVFREGKNHEVQG